MQATNRCKTLLQRSTMADSDRESRFNQVPTAARAQQLGNIGLLVTAMESWANEHGEQDSIRMYAGMCTPIEHWAAADGLADLTIVEIVTTLLSDDELFRNWTPAFQEFLATGVPRGYKRQSRMRGRYQANVHASRRPPLEASTRDDTNR
jgi:hypothetical protein